MNKKYVTRNNIIKNIKIFHDVSIISFKSCVLKFALSSWIQLRLISELASLQKAHIKRALITLPVVERYYVIYP